MTAISYRSLLLCSVLPLVMSACSSSGDGSSAPIAAAAPVSNLTPGAQYGGTGAPADPLAKFTASTFRPTPHEGLETVLIVPGVANTPVVNPILSLQQTTTGFDMNTADGTVRYDTRSGSSTVAGTSQYNNCVEPCATSGLKINTTFNSGGAISLTYSTYGVWTTTGPTGITRVGAFATGTSTTPAQMPTTGTATYTGGAAGYAITNIAANNVSFVGDTRFDLDFAARTMTGGVTNITTRNLATPATSGTLGPIIFGSGSIDLATTHFSGGAAAISFLPGAAIDLTGAVGKVDGVFYGPNAAEAAGSFQLSKTNVSVMGSFGVKR